MSLAWLVAPSWSVSVTREAPRNQQHPSVQRNPWRHWEVTTASSSSSSSSSTRTTINHQVYLVEHYSSRVRSRTDIVHLDFAHVSQVGTSRFGKQGQWQVRRGVTMTATSTTTTITMARQTTRASWGMAIPWPWNLATILTCTWLTLVYFYKCVDAGMNKTWSSPCVASILYAIIILVKYPTLWDRHIKPVVWDCWDPSWNKWFEICKNCFQVSIPLKTKCYMSICVDKVWLPCQQWSRRLTIFTSETGWSCTMPFFCRQMIESTDSVHRL